MSLEWVRFGDYRKHADMYCALCSKTASSDDIVLMNTYLIPHPWICAECAQNVAEMNEYYDEVVEDLRSEWEDEE